MTHAPTTAPAGNASPPPAAAEVVATARARAAEQKARVATIREALGLLHEPGEVFEIRALDVPGRGKPHTAAGWFQDLDLAAKAAELLDREHKPVGTYCTLNPVVPALLARAPEQIGHYPKATTSDAEILHRRWLYIDLDPKRPAGIASTWKEKATAEALAGDLVELLRGFGFPWPLCCDSGNGAHLLYRIDLPNDHETTELIKLFYSGLATKIDAAGVHLDTTVHNAARICRLYGTINRKGAGTADRPHRLSSLTPSPEPLRVVPREAIEAVAALAPAPPSSARAAGNGQHGTGPRLDVPKYLQARGVAFKTKAMHGATAYIVACPFDENHGHNGEAAVVQRDDGLLTYECKHSSCQGRRWADFRDAIGKPDPDHFDRPPARAAAARRFEPGARVKALDRDNIGAVVADFGDSCSVEFVNPSDGNTAVKTLPKSQLVPLGGEGNGEAPGEPPLPPPSPLREIVKAHPKLRPAVIHKLLRVGETANKVASPKAGKSWMVDQLALSVATGRDWLDTFPCEPGNVLIIDAELHPEVIAHRLPMVAEAMGICPTDYQDKIDVWPLRGMGLDLLRLRPSLDTIEPGRYALIILDAWYRFLPPGLSENDNAAVMALYNAIDGYAGRLGAAWVNIHHASKGDQAGKGVTDVGSGAGSQSRAADTHLIIRPHQEDGVAVLEAVVRSFPPVDPVAIRWDFPIWTLATDADPRRLRDSRTVQEQARREQREVRLEHDRRAIVEVLGKYPEGETKTTVSNACGMSRERFGPALASLLDDGNIVVVPILKSGKKTPIDGYRLCEE